MNGEYAAFVVVSACLVAYLVWALLKPEKF